MEVKWHRVHMEADKDFECEPGKVHRTYQLEEPQEVVNAAGRTVKVEYVAADFAYTLDRGPETMLFRADEEGNVKSWTELYAVYRDGVSDDSAMAELFGIGF